MYSPSLGRWLSNDPLGFDAGDQNWYRAIGNNPGNGHDPSGLIWPIVILGGAAIGWLVTSPPPVQAPTKDGEAVFPPFDLEEKIAGVTIGFSGISIIRIGIVAGKTYVRTLIEEANATFELIEKAKNFVGKIVKDSPPRGYKGSGKYWNDGRGGSKVLPKKTTDGKDITYKEYDINPTIPGVDRGGERIVIGTDGRIWATKDHYKNFVEVLK